MKFLLCIKAFLFLAIVTYAQTANDDYKVLYDKIKPLTEMTYISSGASGQSYDDIARMYEQASLLTAEEVKIYPQQIEALKSKTPKAIKLQTSVDEFNKIFASGNDLLKNMIIFLKQDYGNMDKSFFTTEKRDEFKTGVANCLVVFKLMSDLFPERSDYKNYATQTQSMNDAVNKKLEAKYASNYTSPFHSANAQKILLSDKTINVTKEDKTQFKSSFTVGESIKAVLYLNEKIKTFNEGYTSIALDIYFDEAISDDFKSDNGCIVSNHNTIEIAEEETESAVLTFDIIPDDTKTNHISAKMVKKIAACMANLLPGNHTVRLQVGLLPAGHYTAWNKSNTYIIDFELNVTDAGLKMLASKVDKIEAAELAAVRMGRAAMNDPSLLKLVNDAAAKNGHNPLKTVLVSKGWSHYTHKDALGRTVPSYHRIYAEYAFKDKDGKCFIQSVDILKDYTGAGSFTAPYTKAGKEYRKPILCEHVNL